MRVRFTQAALADLTSLFEYIARDNPFAANRVLARAEELATYLERFPHCGHEVNNSGVRVLPMTRYPYRIFYRVRGEEIEILHVWHDARQRPSFE